MAPLAALAVGGALRAAPSVWRRSSSTRSRVVARVSRPRPSPASARARGGCADSVRRASVRAIASPGASSVSVSRGARASSRAPRASSSTASPWLDDQDDAPVRIDNPSGYSHGDDLDRIFVDDDERRAWWASPATSTASPAAASAGPPASVTAWFPACARAAWALVAVAGVAWAAWSGAKHVLFLGVGAGQLRARRRRRQRRRPGGVRRPRRRRARRPRHRPDLRRPLRPRLRGDPPRARRRRGAEASPHARALRSEDARRTRSSSRRLERRARHPRRLRRPKTAAHSACEARQAAASSAIAGVDAPRGDDRARDGVASRRAGGVGVPLLASALARGPRSRPRDGRAERVGDVVRRRDRGGGVDGVHASRSGRGGSTRREGRRASANGEFLAEAHRGTFSCRWRGDPYVAPGKRNQTSADKDADERGGRGGGGGGDRRRAASRPRPRPRSSSTPPTAEPPPRTAKRVRRRVGRSTRDEAGFVTETTYGAGNSVDETFDEEEESASFDDVYGGVEVVVSAPYREGSRRGRRGDFRGSPVAVGGARTPPETSETFPLSSVPLSSEDGIPIPGVSDVSAPALADVSASSPSPTGSGFCASETIFVPNVHTHAVRSLRGDFPRATRSPRTSPTSSRGGSAGATPFHLVYLDHCGAVAQRAQQIWDVFSRHAVADGGVVAATFSTPGQTRGVDQSGGGGGVRARVRRGGGRARVRTRGKCRGGGGCSLNRTRISRDSWTTPCTSSRRDGADRGRPGVETSPSASPSAGESVAASLREHAVAVAAARDEYLRLCDALGGWTTRAGPAGAAVADASGGDLASARRMRRRDSPPLSRGGRRTSRRGRMDAPRCWTRGRVEGEDACVCTRRTRRRDERRGARAWGSEGGGGAGRGRGGGRGPVVVCLLRERTRGYSPAWRGGGGRRGGGGGVGGSAGGGGAWRAPRRVRRRTSGVSSCTGRSCFSCSGSGCATDGGGGGRGSETRHSRETRRTGKGVRAAVGDVREGGKGMSEVSRSVRATRD